MSDLNIAISPRRRTIGILSESAYFESETLIYQGARRAAEQYDFNLALIMPLDDSREATHYNFDPWRRDESEEQFRDRCRKLKAYLDIFELDGLIYIGWSPQFQGARGWHLLDALKPIKLMSISGSHEDVPCVSMNGGPYIGEITRHLIEVHGSRNIAYVHSWAEDGRVDYYKEAMLAHGLYDERLIVQIDELAGHNDSIARMKRAAAILFEERGIPIDAIVVLTAYEGKFMLEELQRRGLHVPGDIRLVCYENDPITQFSEPSLTTIEYPFEALGYAACQQLMAQFSGENIPMVTEQPTRIIYRDSCGCTINNVRPIRPQSEVIIANPAPAASIAEQLPLVPGITFADVERLTDSFHRSMMSGDASFLKTFGELLNGPHRLRAELFDDLLERMRAAFLPSTTSSADQYAQAEAIWYAARYLARNYANERSVDEYVRKSDILKIMNHINKNLLATRTITEVPQVLLNTLGWIEIPVFYLFLMDKHSPHSRPQDSKLFFASDDYGDTSSSYPPDLPFIETIRQFRARKDERNERFSLLVMPLQAAQENIGVAWADPGEHETSTLTSLFDETAKALKGAQLHEEQHSLVGKLSAEIVLRREKEAQLAYFADVDVLTGLFNRRFFYTALQRLHEHYSRFTVLYIDIDDFKQVNDTMGHDAGDRLLRQIADRLRGLLAEDAFMLEHAASGYAHAPLHSIFRMGGDEFTVLLETHHFEDVNRLADKLCGALRQPYDLSGATAVVSSSIGIARYPDDALDQEQLLKYADVALYQAKSVKNQYRFYDRATSDMP